MASMTFEFLDVGMGDGTLVTMGTSTTSAQELALIDLGIQPFTKFKIGKDDAGIYLTNTISANSTKRGMNKPYLDHLFITHPDQDHYNLIKPLINANYPNFPGKKLSIGRLTFGGVAANYPGLIEEITPFVVDQNIGPLANKAQSDVLIDGTVDTFRTFVNGSIKVYLLSANYPSATVTGKGTPNPKSVCLMFQNGQNKMIFMGDAEEDVERRIIKNFKDADDGFLNAYGLKLGHHGSKAGTSEDWIKAVKPSAIFASGDMVWAHPYCEPINRVISAGTLKSTANQRYFCCGGDGKEYFNHPTKLEIGLNLWYVVKSPGGEWMLEEETNKKVFIDEGVTWGVQWELEFASGNARPSLNRTQTAIPV